MKPHIYLSSPIYGSPQWVGSGSLANGVAEFIMHLQLTHPLTKQA